MSCAAKNIKRHVYSQPSMYDMCVCLYDKYKNLKKIIPFISSQPCIRDFFCFSAFHTFISLIHIWQIDNFYVPTPLTAEGRLLLLTSKPAAEPKWHYKFTVGIKRLINFESNPRMTILSATTIIIAA